MKAELLHEKRVTSSQHEQPNHKKNLKPACLAIVRLRPNESRALEWKESHLVPTWWAKPQKTSEAELITSFYPSKRSPSSSSADCFNCCQSSVDHTVSIPRRLARQRSLVTLAPTWPRWNWLFLAICCPCFWAFFLSFVKLALSMLCWVPSCWSFQRDGTQHTSKGGD